MYGLITMHAATSDARRATTPGRRPLSSLRGVLPLALALAALLCAFLLDVARPVRGRGAGAAAVSSASVEVEVPAGKG